MKKKIKPFEQYGLNWYRFEDLLKEDLKSKKFRKAYYEERERLRLAGQVRLLREKKKLTQKQVAQKADMPQSVIARLESGTHSVSADTLGRIAHALGKQVQIV